MSGVTIFFKEGKEREFYDTVDCIYNTQTVEGHLHVTETLRLIAGTNGGWKSPRTMNIFPPGEWREVEFSYINPPVYEPKLKYCNAECREMETCICGMCEWK